MKGNVMELHPKAKEQILTLLTDGLQHVIVKNGKFLDRLSAFLSFYGANNALPKQGKYAQLLEEWVGDLPFLEFCSDTLTDELSLHGEYIGNEDRRPLVQTVGFEDAGSVAQRLTNSFETLPWTYNLTLELGPNTLPPFPGEATSYSLGDDTQLVISNLLLADEFPLTSPEKAIEERLKGLGLMAALLGDEQITWNGDAAYFQTQVQGFVGLYGGGSPMDRATSRLKSFLGLGLAMGLFSHEASYDSSPARKDWTVHRRDGETWAVRHRVWLDDEDNRTLRGLKLWDKFGTKYPEQHQVPWLQSVLAQVSAALSSPHSATLRLAAQWFWDSYKGTDEVLRYVRRMTTLEILLGEGADTTAASLGEILGNRLAYSIGKTHKERSDIQGDFKKIYNVRSRILHRGKHRLIGDERVLLTRLQTLCEQALKQEAKIVAVPEQA